MMRTCDCCGVCDDLENMFYGTNNVGETLCVCEGCSTELDEVVSVDAVANAILGSK